MTEEFAAQSEVANKAARLEQRLDRVEQGLERFERRLGRFETRLERSHALLLERIEQTEMRAYERSERVETTLLKEFRKWVYQL